MAEHDLEWLYGGVRAASAAFADQLDSVEDGGVRVPGRATPARPRPGRADWGQGRFRGGDAYTYRIDGGVLEVSEGRPPRADCHIVADPVTFLNVSLGRTSQVRAGLAGKIIGYGRKPWLLLPLGRVQVDGI